ncbi:MAG: hypothetical protein JSS43_12245, partial [Proteobacteria bacterium]|nr:hypothetical protein [Pseudomonadota bacterium]
MSRSVPYTREAVWTRSRVFWIDAAVVAVTILPLLLTQHLPLADLPNHLARMYILRDWHNSPNLQAFYVPHWALVPNLALELFVLALRPVLSPDGAVRAFCIVTVLMLFLGTRSVNRAVSDGTATAYRVAPLLVYGGPFQYGFLSYCFGVGLALVAFGWYLRLRPLAGWRLPLVMALGFALLLCHLAAFGLFALALGGCELAAAFEASRGHWRRLPAEILRRQIAPVGCLVPVLAVFLLLSPTADPAMAAENVVRFSTLQEKLRSVAAITLFTQPRLETALLALALAGLAVALVLRAVRVHRVLAFVVPLMALLWLVLPNIAAHTSFIDYRLPWAISFFLLGGIVAGPSWHRYRSLLAAGFGTLAFARVTLIAVLWLRWEPTLAAIDH